MKKSLLVWGALIVIALCFVGCCYYNTSHNHMPCNKHCKHKPCCCESGKQCPDSNTMGDEVDTVTVEAIEIVPLDNNTVPAQKPAAAKHTSATHAEGQNQAAAPATQAK